MSALKNTWRTIECAAPEVVVALDACEQGRADAHRLLVGLPATISIGSDRYAAVVVSATPSLKIICVEFRGYPDSERMRFTLRKDGGYRSTGRGSYRLTVGIAHDYRDPEF